MMNNCRAKSGMLVLRDCGRPASGNCVSCGKPVCGRHKCPTERGTACPECAAMLAAQAAQQPGAQPLKGKAAKAEAKRAAAQEKQQQKQAQQQAAAQGMTPEQRARARDDWYGYYPYYAAAPYFHYHDYGSFSSGGGSGFHHTGSGSSTPQPDSAAVDQTGVATGAAGMFAADSFGDHTES